MAERWTYRRYRRGSFSSRYRFPRLGDMAVVFAIVAMAVFFVARLDKLAVEKVVGNPVLADGDSLRLGGERVRMKGIDAPEYDQTCIKAGESYPCGRLAKQALQNMIAGKEMACKGWERDHYGRVLAICRIGDVNLNRRMVEEGWAVAYGEYHSEQHEARKQKRGMWAGTFQTPHQWRESHGSNGNEGDPEGNAWTWLREFFRMK